MKSKKQKLQKVKPALKKAAPKKAKPSDPVAQHFDEWKAGRLRASQIAAELSLPRSKVRKRLRDLAGGKAAYAAIMATFAPALPSSNGRSKGPPKPVDDSKAKVISTIAERKKWDVRNIQGKLHPWPTWRYTAPDGAQYEVAHSLAKADVIIKFSGEKGRGLAPTRLVRISETKLVKDAKRKKGADDARAERKAAKQAAKKAKRIKRKGQIAKQR